MECYSCGNEYDRIAAHWSRGSCSHPSFTEKQKNVIKGILMGDGTIDDKFDDRRNPRFKLYITNLEYAKYVYDVFENLATQEPYIHMTSEELAETRNELSSSTNPNDYKTQYKLQTISHPELDEFQQWYSTGEKVFPKQLELNPIILKHWYVCDGSFNNNGHRFYTEIHLSNERENKDKIEGYFKDIGIEVDRWRDDKVEGRYKTSIIFNKGKSEKLFGYMGEPLPGFSYKWPSTNTGSDHT